MDSALGKRSLRVTACVLAALGLAAPAPVGAASLAGASSLHVADVTGPETRTNGRIFATDADGSSYSCSGTALATPSRSIVLTAGHCVVEDGIWGRRLTFVPAYENGSRPFGTFTVSATYVMRQWRDAYIRAFDLAALRVKPNELGRLGDVVGGRYWTTGGSRFASLQIFGYPTGALQGEWLRSCATTGLGSDARTHRFPGPPTLPAVCDMAGGSSGGAWLIDGRVAGVTSYGYPLNLGRLYSPYFGSTVGAFLADLP